MATDKPKVEATGRTLPVQSTAKTVVLRYSPKPVKWIISTKEHPTP